MQIYNIKHNLPFLPFFIFRYTLCKYGITPIFLIPFQMHSASCIFTFFFSFHIHTISTIMYKNEIVQKLKKYILYTTNGNSIENSIAFLRVFTVVRKTKENQREHQKSKMEEMDCTMVERQGDGELPKNTEHNHEQINQGRNESSQKPKEETMNKELMELLQTYKEQNAELKKELKRLKYSRGARGAGTGSR
ncbi:uncharacterized protein LOC114882282 [Osmia bicornis bicornis]|uniref:uncharacterized protein LOC114882282 n=1 Tax=Osmia bicornis bicornis TaxID=1437191 RepID=UPI0010F73AE6|nr:uncharacterized protein LOC114882282 [Osmia bicornis bicornis]